MSVRVMFNELSRAASGLVKVLCKPCDGVAGGKGSQG